MSKHRGFRRASKKIDFSDASDIARKAMRTSTEARVRREFRENGVAKLSDSHGWTYVLTRSAKQPGWFQVTWFNADMEPLGDANRPELREAIKYMVRETRFNAKRVPIPKGLKPPVRAAKVRISRAIGGRTADVMKKKAADNTTEVTLADKHRGKIYLAVRDGVVVGAMGSDPDRFIGKTLDQAKHIARYGGAKKVARGSKVLGGRVVKS